MISFCFFSVIRTGFGHTLCMFGIIIFLLLFQFKLHTLPDANGLKKHSNISFLLLYCGVYISVYQLLYFLIKNETESHDEIDLIIHHLFYLIAIVFWNIFLPKLYIQQNPKLSLYVKVYHHHPPPILPWQIPENFDPRSVKLVIVNKKNK